MKNSYIFIVTAFLLIVSLSLITSATTFISPVASGNISGSFILNASGVALSNCTFYAKSASTANSSWVNLGEFINDTSADSTYVNGTYNSIGLEDASDYIFNATCRNHTNEINAVTITGVTIDNTVPQAPTLGVANATVYTDTNLITITSTVTNRNTTACTYVSARGSLSGDNSASGAATYSAASCSFTRQFPGPTYNGDYYYSITASDGRNTSTSNGYFTLTIPYGSGGSGGSSPSTETPSTGDQIQDPTIEPTKNFGQKVKDFIISFKDKISTPFKNLGQALKNFKDSIKSKLHK